MKTIVIVGAGLAAMPLIRQVMRTMVLPADDLKLVVVCPNTHMHWTLAMVRHVVPGKFRDDDLMIDLKPIFAQYPADKFEWVMGKATALEPSSNIVEVGLNGGGQRSVPYDVLVAATGSTAADGMPWKVLGDTETTKAALHRVQEQIKNAKTIVVAGGGLTGTETAGELGNEYALTGAKEVYFVYSGELPLAAPVIESCRKTSQAQLEKLKVKLLPNSTVTKTTASGSDTLIEVRSKDGKTKTITAQAYLPATGLKPNSSWVPSDMLDEHGTMKQTTTLRAEGHDNIFVIGDVGNLEASKAMHAESQFAHLIKELPVYMRNDGSPLPEYKPSASVIHGITLGPKTGTGHMGGWRLPGFMIVWSKGRYLGTNVTSDYANGKRSMMNKFE